MLLLLAAFCGGAACGRDGLAPGSGTVRFVTVTAGPDPDPTGYSIAIDRTESIALPANGTVLRDVASGAHHVELSGISRNCATASAPPAQLVVRGGDTTTLVVRVGCRSTLAGKIVFSSYRTGRWALYVVRPDGSDLVPLPNGEDGSVSSVAPDGSKLAYSARDSVIVMNADGTDRHALGPGTWPAWSPDGTRIAFTDFEGDLAVMGADGSGRRNLTNTLPWDGNPRWSPDGRRIVFGSVQTGRDQVYVMNLDGTDAHSITPSFTAELPSWNHGGDWIAFAGGREGDRSWTIYIAHPDGSGLTRVSPTNDYEDLMSDWSPNDESLVAASRRGRGDWEIYVFRTDGSGRLNLSNHPDDDLWPVFGPALE